MKNAWSFYKETQMNQNYLTELDENHFQALNKLVDDVAQRQLKDFGNINSEIKSDGTLITSCDRWSDSHIVNGLKEISKNQEGILSEEGSKILPSSEAFWIVDPLDGTTNFSAGIPFWAISIARFTGGKPQTAILDIPPLKKRILAIKGKGVWVNNKKITSKSFTCSKSDCVSVCSRSIRVLQKQPDKRFPGKIRLLGVSSLNMTSVALGQTFGALEATPKIWDIAAAWLILKEMGCSIQWLDIDPINLKIGEDLSTVNFPLIAASSQKDLERLLLWGNTLID